MVQGGMLSGEVYSSFWTDDFLKQKRLLPGVKKREGSSRKFIVMPHPGSSHFKLFQDLRMDFRHILQRLFNAILR